MGMYIIELIVINSPSNATNLKMNIREMRPYKILNVFKFERFQTIYFTSRNENHHHPMCDLKVKFGYELLHIYGIHSTTLRCCFFFNISLAMKVINWYTFLAYATASK